MKNYIKIEIDSASPVESEILMAELSENNFYAFEQHENTLAAYIKEDDFSEEKLQAVLPANSAYGRTVIAGRNWNEEWERQLAPVMIDDFAGIRASFHEPLRGVQHEIIVTPKMSFGTGHHATTFLMVEQMSKIDFSHKTVVDFGTGTGVLAILAEKLGADSVIAIDCDEWSIQNARENIAANHCKRIKLVQADNIGSQFAVNIILANINLRVLTESAHRLSMILQPGALLIISGFLAHDEEMVNASFRENQFCEKARNEKSDWVVKLLEKC